MTVKSLAVGRLSDGRLQLFATVQDGSIWSQWKEDTGADAPWSPWTAFEPNGTHDYTGFVLGTFDTASMQYELLLIAGYPAGGPSLGGPVVASTRKLSFTDPNSSWSDMQTLYAGQFGPPGSTATGITALAGAHTPGQRLQAFFYEAGVGGSGPFDSKLMTTWKETSKVDSPWLPVMPFEPPCPIPPRPLYAANLSSDQMQIWGGDGYNIWSTWKTGEGEDDPWVQWLPFEALPAGQPIAFASGIFGNNSFQLWAASDAGPIYKCWKEDLLGAPFGPWEQFLPNEPTAQNMKAIAVGQLSDGRLQFWGADAQGILYTTWQSSPPSREMDNWEGWGATPGPP